VLAYRDAKGVGALRVSIDVGIASVETTGRFTVARVSVCAAREAGDSQSCISKRLLRCACIHGG
jgi:hypothetical protein